MILKQIIRSGDRKFTTWVYSRGRDGRVVHVRHWSSRGQSLPFCPICGQFGECERYRSHWRETVRWERMGRAMRRASAHGQVFNLPERVYAPYEFRG